MRKFFSVFLGLIIFAATGVVVAPRFIDWNSYKLSVAQTIKKMTGRELTINGNIRIAILPAPAFVAEDISFANPEIATSPYMATLKSAEMRVALIPLLTGRVQVETIKLIEPVIRLERFSDGSTNWEFKKALEILRVPSGTTSAFLTEKDEGALIPIALDNLSIDNATLIYSDPFSGVGERIDNFSAKIVAASLQGPMETNGTANVRGIPLNFGLNVGEIINGRTVPVVLRASSDKGQFSVQIGGTVVNLEKEPSFKGNFKLDGNDLSKIFELNSLAGPLSLIARPYRLGGLIKVNAAEMEMENVELGLGKTNATGDLRLEFDDNILANAHLELKKLDLDEILNGEVFTASKVPKLTNEATQTRPRSSKVVPARLGFELSKTLDASVIVSVDAIVYRNDLIRDAVLNARLSDGKLTVSQISAQFPGGSDVAASVQMEVRDGAPNFKADLESSVSNFRGVLNWLGFAVSDVPSDRLRKMSARAQIAGTLEEFQVRNIDLYFDSSHLTGGVTVALRERPGFGANLALDRLNLDSYLQPRKSNLSGGARADVRGTKVRGRSVETKEVPLNVMALLSHFDANVKASVKSLVYKSKPIRELVVDATLFKGDAEIRRLSVGKFGSAAVNLKGQVKGLVGVPDFQNLEFETKVQDPARFVRALGMIELPVAGSIGEIKAKGEINGNLLRPRIDMISKVAGGSVIFKGMVSVLPGSDAMKGHLSLKHKNLPVLLRRFGILYRPASDSRNIDLYADVIASWSTVSLNNVRAVLGKLIIGGKGDIDFRGRRPFIKASIKSSALSLDNFFSTPQKIIQKNSLSTSKKSPVVSTNSNGQPQLETFVAGNRFSKETIDLTGLDAVDADVTVKAPLLTYGKILIDNLDAEFSIRDQKLKVPKLTGRVFEGNFDASMEAFNQDSNRFVFKGSIDGAKITEFLATFSEEISANGRMKVNLNLTSSGDSVRELVNRLSGNGSMELTKLSIIKLEGGSAVTSPLEPLFFLDKLAGATSKNKAKMTGNFLVERGVVRSNDIEFASAYGNGFSSGDINLPMWKINMKGRLELGQRLQDQLRKININENSSAIPFTMTGGLSGPKVKIDAGVLLGKGNGLFEVDKILNRAPDGVGKILKGILGGVVQQPRFRREPLAPPSSVPSGGSSEPADSALKRSPGQKPQINPEQLLKELLKL